MAQSLREFEIYPITVRDLQVLRVADVTPGMRRVTLGGPGLAAHTAPNGRPVAAFRSDGFDDEFKLFFTHPSLSEPLKPVQGDGHVEWPRDERLISRTYSVRRWDPVAGEVDVDFVIHGHGVATMWARTVEVGTTIPVAGPKMSGTHPQGADGTLVIGDETALPAIGRWLEEWPPGHPGRVLIEVAEDQHRQDLTIPEGVEVTWLSRHGAAPGTTTLLLDALRAADLPEGRMFAWAAGEALTLVPIRRHLRNELGLPREQVDVTGYWRRSPDAARMPESMRASSPDADPATVPTEDHDEHEELEEAIEALTQLLAPLALRTAVTLGLFEPLTGGPLGTGELARTTGTRPEALERFLPYLAEQELLSQEDHRWSLTPLGEEFADAEDVDFLDLSGADAIQELAEGLGLLAVLTPAGDPRGELPTVRAARSLSAALRSDPALISSALDEAEAEAALSAATLAGMLPLHDGMSVDVIGPGAAEVGRSIARREPGARVRVLVEPAEVEVIRSRLAGSSRLEIEELPARGTADLVILALALSSRGTEEAGMLLADALRMAGSPDRLCVFEEVAEADEEPDAEDELLSLISGRPLPRSDEEWTRLLDAAGMTGATGSNVGWGGKLYRTPGTP